MFSAKKQKQSTEDGNKISQQTNRLVNILVLSGWYDADALWKDLSHRENVVKYSIIVQIVGDVGDVRRTGLNAM